MNDVFDEAYLKEIYEAIDKTIKEWKATNENTDQPGN